MHGDHRIACGIDNILAPVFVEYTISLTNKYVWHTIPVVLAANAGPGPLTLTTRVQDFSKIPKCRAKCFDLVHAGEIKSLVDDKEFRSLDSVLDAIDYMLSGQAIGKVVVSL